MLTCLILEDDPVAREILRAQVESFPDMRVAAACASAEEALPAFIKHEPNFLLVDVEMPGMTGFEFLKTLHRPIPTVLITSFPSYAAQAFEYRVADFIVKPVTLPRLAAALHRIREMLGGGETRQQLANHLFVRTGEEYTRFSLSEVLWFEAQGSAATLYSTNGRHELPMSLQAIEKAVAHTPLHRVHRSYIVNLEQVELYEPPDALKLNGKIIPIGRVYRNRLQSILPLVK